MATIYFSISSRANSRGQHRVHVRLSGGAKVTPRAKTDIYVSPLFWNAKKGGVVLPRVGGDAQREALQVKRDLDDLSLFLLETFEQLHNRSDATSEWLQSAVNRFSNPQQVADVGSSFFDAFDEFLRVKKYAYDRHKSMLGLRRILLRFEAFDGVPLDLDTFDHHAVGRLDEFLRSEHIIARDPANASLYEAVPEKRMPAERAQNTINGMHARLRTFIRWCVEQGKTNTNGYMRFKVEEDVYGTPIYITVDDRKALYLADMPTEALSVQRDIFVFQCCIGCRVSDLERMTPRNVIRGAIEYVARKTRDGRPITVRVPLNDTAKEIIARYAGGTKLLPFIAKQAYNRAVKECFKAAGLDRMVMWLNPKTREAEPRPLYEVVASHMARRTFAGNLYQKLKDPNVIASMTGHKEGSRAFARYRAIDDQIKTEAVTLLD